MINAISYLMTEEHKQRYRKIVFSLIILLGILWVGIRVNKGIDIEDSGYYMARYKYIFSEDVILSSPSMLFTSIIGGIFYNLFPSHQMLILSVLGCAVYGITGMVVYKYFKRRAYDFVLAGGIVFAVLFSCGWIKMLNYNSLSMFFRTVVIILLLKGVKTGKSWLTFAAGFIIAFNVFVRLPNILEVCLGGVLFWYYGICLGNWKKFWREAGVYAAGGFSGGIISLGLVCVFSGKSAILETVINTMNTASDGGSSHGLVSIFSTISLGMERGLSMWINKVFILIIVLYLLVFLCKKYIPRVNVWRYLSMGMIALGFIWGMLINNIYTAGAMIAVVLFLIGVWAMCSGELSAYERTVFCMLVIAEVILPIGTDNAWYYQVVFMIFPVAVLTVLMRHINFRQSEGRRYVHAVLVFAIATIAGCGFTYSAQYVYRDLTYDQLTYKVNIPECAGMKTEKGKGQALEKLSSILNDLDSQYKYLAELGGCCISYSMSELKPCFMTAWPDLEGFSEEEFTNQFNEKIQEGEYPIVVIADFELNNEVLTQQKYFILTELMVQYEYETFYECPYFTVYTY